MWQRRVYSLVLANCRGFATQSSNKPIGFVGLGKMGSAMATNLMSAGYELYVYDVNQYAVDTLVEKGATAATSSGDVAAEVETVISMLPNDDILRKECQPDTNNGIIGGMKQDNIHISCSTISPQTARELARAHEAKGSYLVSAPIFARPDGVAKKEAFMPMAGHPEAVKQAKELMGTTTSQIFEFGQDPGAANTVKLCGNFMIAAAIESMAESLALAEANGVDRVQLTKMLTSTIFDCIIYKGYGQRVSERDHKKGGFDLDLGYKDVSLVLNSAAKEHVPMPFGSVLRDRFITAMAKDRAGMDWSGIALSASEDSGLDLSDIINKIEKSK